MWVKKKIYTMVFENTISNTRNTINQFNNHQLKLQNDIISTLGLFIKKIDQLYSESIDINYFERGLTKKSFLRFDERFISFNDLYIDYSIYELNYFLKNRTKIKSKMINKLLVLQEGIKEEDIRMVKEFSLLLLNINKKCLNRSKEKELSWNFANMLKNKVKVKFFFKYLSCMLLRTGKVFIFNSFAVSLLEDFILGAVGNFFDGKVDNDSVLVDILIICYDIISSSNIHKQIHFSEDFSLFIRNFNLWFQYQTWETFYNCCFDLLEENSFSIYFNDINHGNDKIVLRHKKDIFKVVIFVSFHFLKLPFNMIMNNACQFNKENSHVALNELINISQCLESKLYGNYNRRLTKRIQTKTVKPFNVKMDVLKMSLDYLDVKKDNLTRLLLLNSSVNQALSKKVFKLILKSSSSSKKDKLFLWRIISRTERKVSENGSYTNGNKKVRYADIIEMDVKRTNFAIEKSDKLRNLLYDVANTNPKTSYYQGMNCIGGFLLKYTNDFQLCQNLFNFLIKERFEKYLLNNFMNVSQLIYLAEEIIRLKLPSLHAHIKTLGIDTAFYFSPLLLTSFASCLQFIDYYDFVAIAFDYFICESWAGFFKVFVYIFQLLEDDLVKMGYEQFLEFINKHIYKEILKINTTDLKVKIDSIFIDRKLIIILENEYYRSRKIIDDFWNDFYQRRKEGTD